MFLTFCSFFLQLFSSIFQEGWSQIFFFRLRPHLPSNRHAADMYYPCPPQFSCSLRRKTGAPHTNENTTQTENKSLKSLKINIINWYKLIKPGFILD